MRFFNRRSALSTGSPFFNLISVTPRSHPLQDSGIAHTAKRHLSGQAWKNNFRGRRCQLAKYAALSPVTCPGDNETAQTPKYVPTPSMGGPFAASADAGPAEKVGEESDNT